MIHGPASYRRLATCHSDLQRLVIAAAEEWDLIVVSGHRTKEEQEDAVERKTSKLHWPHSRHNALPSEAVDLAPYPLDWQDLRRFDLLGTHVLGVAKGLQLAITWGGNWAKKDLPHFQLGAA